MIPCGSIVPLEHLVLTLPPSMRIMGMDLGTKTLGLSISDELRMIASPLMTIKRTKFRKDVCLLLDLCKRHVVGALVIGLPINMDGSEGPRALSTRGFVYNLVQCCDLPVVYWDERLSTQAATRPLLESGSSRARRKELVDKVAAAYILQGALDRLSNILRSA